jgi:hypothetical protein
LELIPGGHPAIVSEANRRHAKSRLSGQGLQIWEEQEILITAAAPYRGLPALRSG